MRLDQVRIKRLCLLKGLTLSAALDGAGVSRTAYYHLRSKESVLPSSLLRLAQTLGVLPEELLKKTDARILRIRELQTELEEIVRGNSQAYRENIWHTLLLLEEAPLKRLQRALARGKHTN